GFLQHVAASPCQHHGESIGMQRQRGGASYAAAGACDDRDLARRLHGIILSSSAAVSRVVRAESKPSWCEPIGRAHRIPAGGARWRSTRDRGNLPATVSTGSRRGATMEEGRHNALTRRGLLAGAAVLGGARFAHAGLPVPPDSKLAFRLMRHGSPIG